MTHLAVPDIQARNSWRRIYFNAASIPFWSIHLGALAGVAYLGFSWSGVALAAFFYFFRMFFVTGALHRYFSHRTYKTSRWFQFVLALFSSFTAQKGVLWWAAHHRHHHRYSDEEIDIHSVRQGGFWWSHMGWILCYGLEKTEWDDIKDFAKYPELRWLNNHFHVPLIAWGALFFLVGGFHALVWGFAVSTVLLWHGTFTINSLSHLFGNRRYETTDDSRNNLVLALITMGEGWHNNHHYYQRSCRQGFRWWQIDMTYYGLRALQAVGLIWDIKDAPPHVVHERPKQKAVEIAARARARAEAARDRVGEAAAAASEAVESAIRPPKNRHATTHVAG